MVNRGWQQGLCSSEEPITIWDDWHTFIHHSSRVSHGYHCPYWLVTRLKLCSCLSGLWSSGAHAICSSSNGSKVHAVEQNTFEVPTVRWKVAHISTYHEGKVLA
ncbi:unnamed protein product [Urochloa humidicola]